MKFNVGDKVKIIKVNSMAELKYERFVGTEWEVWEVKDNGEYILSFGFHKVWNENQLKLVERALVPGEKRKYTGYIPLIANICVEIEAENKDEAMDKLLEMYDNGEIHFNGYDAKPYDQWWIEEKL